MTTEIPVHYINISLGLESNCHLFANVGRTDNETKGNLFYIALCIALRMLPKGNFLSDVVCLSLCNGCGEVWTLEKWLSCYLALHVYH